MHIDEKPQPTQKNLDLGKDIASDSGHQQAPTSLPLFPTRWLNVLKGPATQVAPDQPTNDTSLEFDEFLNALGYLSKLTMNNAQELSRASANCGDFMYALANSSEMDEAGQKAFDNVVANDKSGGETGNSP